VPELLVHDAMQGNLATLLVDGRVEMAAKLPYANKAAGNLRCEAILCFSLLELGPILFGCPLVLPLRTYEHGPFKARMSGAVLPLRFAVILLVVSLVPMEQ
jgi:hypothetical protein